MFEKNVITAIHNVAEQFIGKEVIYLTESDFKSHLSNSIKNEINSNNITINTETPWYDTYTTNKTYYIDITIFYKEKLNITYDPKLNRKGYKYDNEALAIELKYFRYKDDISEIEKDFFKISLLIKAPKNQCFIIAIARNTELFDLAKVFMKEQLNIYKSQYLGRVNIYLFGPDEIAELT